MKLKKKARRLITILVFLIIISVGIVKMSKMYYNYIEVVKFNKNIDNSFKSYFEIIGKQASLLLQQNNTLTVNELVDPNIKENKSIIDINSNFLEMKCTSIYYVKDDYITRSKYIISEKSRYEVLSILKINLGDSYKMDIDNEELANSFTWTHENYTINFKDNVENMIISIEKTK